MADVKVFKSAMPGFPLYWRYHCDCCGSGSLAYGKWVEAFASAFRHARDTEFHAKWGRVKKSVRKR